MNQFLTKKRDPSIDCVKGLAIIAVVLSHLHFYWPSIPENNISITPLLFSLWHVPVFFCVAGFFIKEERLLKPFEFIKNKIRTLYLKTILYVGFSVILHNLFIKVGLYSVQLEYGGKAMFLYSVKDTIIALLKTVFFMGREPITTILWFAYVLFLALCGYSMLAYLLNKLLRMEHEKKFMVRGIVILSITVVANILTQNFGITQNRVSNVFPAMLLIYIGQWFNVEKKLKYDSPFAAITCFILVVQTAIRSGSIGLNNNLFYDSFHLVVGGAGVTYLLLFLVRKINIPHVKSCLAFLGNYSFSIMGLHLLCFKPCVLVWNYLFSTSFDLAALIPEIGTHYFAGMFFLIFACFVSAAIGCFFEKIVLRSLFEKCKRCGDL